MQLKDFIKQINRDIPNCSPKELDQLAEQASSFKKKLDDIWKIFQRLESSSVAQSSNSTMDIITDYASATVERPLEKKSFKLEKSLRFFVLQKTQLNRKELREIAIQYQEYHQNQTDFDDAVCALHERIQELAEPTDPCGMM